MSEIFKKLKNFFGGLLRKKEKAKKIPKHPKRLRKREKHIVHRKIKHAKTKIHGHIKKHVVHRIKKIKHRKVQKKIRERPKQFLPKKKGKTEKTIFGIPKKHKHEAELKIAEKSTDIEGEYSKEVSGKKVQLKIQEKTSGEEGFGEDKGKHVFFFKSRKKPEKQERLKKEKKKFELKYDPSIYLDEKKKKDVKKILQIIKSRKQKNLIVTNLDIILELVNQMGEVRVDHIADTLEINEKKVEEMANILENNNLIEIHYPAFGKTELRKIKEKQEKEAE